MGYVAFAHRDLRTTRRAQIARTARGCGARRRGGRRARGIARVSSSGSRPRDDVSDGSRRWDDDDAYAAAAAAAAAARARAVWAVIARARERGDAGVAWAWTASRASIVVRRGWSCRVCVHIEGCRAVGARCAPCDRACGLECALNRD